MAVGRYEDPQKCEDHSNPKSLETHAVQPQARARYLSFAGLILRIPEGLKRSRCTQGRQSATHASHETPDLPWRSSTRRRLQEEPLPQDALTRGHRLQAALFQAPRQTRPQAERGGKHPSLFRLPPSRLETAYVYSRALPLDSLGVRSQQSLFSGM